MKRSRESAYSYDSLGDFDFATRFDTRDIAESASRIRAASLYANPSDSLLKK